MTHSSDPDGEGPADGSPPPQDPAGSAMLPVTESRMLLDQPGWFAAVMGTGATALVAQADPGQFAVISPVSQALAWVFFIAAALFFCFLLVRNVIIRRTLRSLGTKLRSSDAGATYATLPGAINVLAIGLLHVVGVGETPVGRWVVLILAVVGTVSGLALTVVFFTAAFENDDFEAEDISGTWFIPETVILLGAVLFGDLSSLLPVSAQRTAGVLSFMLLGIGLVLFALTATLFFNRLVLHRQRVDVGPPAMWIMISPLSVSALAILAVAADTSMLGGTWSPAVLQTANFLAAVLWGFSIWWIAAATVLTIHAGRRALTYTAADWGFVFPSAAMVLATLTLGRFWQSGFMEGLGLLLSFVLLAVWGSVFVSAIVALRADRRSRST